MEKKECCKYYVFDNATNEFIEENGGMAEVGEEYVNEIRNEMNISYLTFIRKEDYEDFIDSHPVTGEVN